MPERIQFETLDDVVIFGDWQPSPKTLAAAVLVHMLPADRTSWAPLQPVLAKKGIASLAIDLRGHGLSVRDTSGNLLDYQKFSDEEHASSFMDIKGAVEWVKKRGIAIDRIFLVGASIGANLSLEMLADEPRMLGAALLSPGEDYHSVRIFEDAPNLLPQQSLFIVSSEDDPQSFDASRRLYEEAPVSQKTFQPYRNGGHGTALLADPSLTDKIANWMMDKLKA